MVYTATFWICWAVVPLLQSFSVSGDFHFVGKLQYAFKFNALFYGIMMAVSVVLLVWIAVTVGITEPAVVYGLGIALSNAWGLLLLILLLGYGLVEVPRRLWINSKVDVLYRWYCFQVRRPPVVLVSLHLPLCSHTLPSVTPSPHQVVEKDRHLRAAQTELTATLKAVQNAVLVVPYHDPNRRYLDRVVLKCPPDFQARAAQLSPREKRKTPGYDAMCALHSRVKDSLAEVRRQRTLHAVLIEEAFSVEDILNNSEAPERVFKSPLRGGNGLRDGTCVPCPAYLRACAP